MVGLHFFHDPRLYLKQCLKNICGKGCSCDRTKSFSALLVPNILRTFSSVSHPSSVPHGISQGPYRSLCSLPSLPSIALAHAAQLCCCVWSWRLRGGPVPCALYSLGRYSMSSCLNCSCIQEVGGDTVKYPGC